MPRSPSTVPKNFPNLTPRNVVSDLDHVFSELKQSMMMGQFVPGQKLKLGELAQAFGTSHMPVREALNRLAMVQAINTAPRRSPSVPPADAQQLRDILSLRVDLESKAAGLAIENDDKTLLPELKSVNEKMDIVGRSNNPNVQHYLELNQRFHFAIYTRSQNAVLLNMIELLWMRYGPLLNLISSGGELSFEHSQHVQIIEAIERRDVAAVGIALRNDLSAAATAIENKIAAGKNAHFRKKRPRLSA